MTNICSEHERVALELLDEYADNSKETKYGTIKWIEPNDEKFRISWGRVVEVKLDWYVDGSGWCCLISVKSDKDGKCYDDLLLRDESDEDQLAVVNLLCDWSADFRVCRPKDICQVLREMADYAEECEDEEERRKYFQQIVSTDLCLDAIGKVVYADNDCKVIVTKEY